MSKYVYEFDPDEPNNTAASIFRLASRGGPRVLDIGSGPGIVSSALVRLAGKDATCVDSDADALAAAEQAGVTRSAVVDLERPDWYEGVPEREYDVVILADILEHLYDPATTLRTLREQKIVAPDAVVIVSFPNVAHQSIVGQLLAGTFTYTETGLLDRTHIRFFTLTTMRDLLEENGFLVEEVHRTFRTMEQTVHAHVMLDLPESARNAIRETGDEGRTFQYVLVGRPSDAAAQLAMVRGELGRLREKHWEAEQLRRRLDETKATLEQERAYYEKVRTQLQEHRETVARLDAENRRLRAAERSLQEQVRVERRKIKQIKSSNTFKVGLAAKRLAATLARARSGLQRRS